MKPFLGAAALLLLAGQAAAQTPPAQIGAPNVPAPWWMHEPVIASIGDVRAELPANRAEFSASFSVVDKTAEDASRKAIGRVQEISRNLAGYGVERAQIETALFTRPLYEQYRTKEGQVQENQRADKIDSYEVTANLTVRVRDLSIIQPVVAAVLAAKPSSITQVGFSLEPSNELLTKLQEAAIKDAVQRARLAVDSAGGRLGALRLIDPTARACRTDVLAGWPSYAGTNQGATNVSQDIARFAPAPAPPPPPPPPPPPSAPGGNQQTLQLTLQPPLRQLNDTACVVFSIGG